MSRAADKIRREVGQRLNMLRNEKRYDRDQMAGWMGTTHSAYYKNEKGINFPNLPSLARLNREHDMSMDWLLFGKGPRHFKDKGNVEHLDAELKKTKQLLETTTKEKENAVPEFRKSLKPGVDDLLKAMDGDSRLYHSVMMFVQDYMDKQEPQKK